MIKKTLSSLTLSLVLAAMTACGGPGLDDAEATYDPATADRLVNMVKNGDELDQDDYAAMIETTRTGLIEMNRAMDSARVDSRQGRDSLLKADGRGGSPLGKLVANCTVLERVLRNADLDKSNKSSYNDLKKLEKEYVEKFK